MKSDEIIQRLEATATDYRSSVQDSATLTMLALALAAREEFPDAVYIEFSVTDQDHSGSLDVVAVCDGAEQPLSDPDGEDIDVDYIAPNLDDRNKSVWLPYMTPSDQPDRYRSYYHLILDKVLAEIKPETAEPDKPGPVAAFLADFAKWVEHRAGLSAQEADGGPAPGSWGDSDDTAVDLLRRAAQLLGARVVE